MGNPWLSVCAPTGRPCGICLFQCPSPALPVHGVQAGLPLQPPVSRNSCQPQSHSAFLVYKTSRLSWRRGGWIFISKSLHLLCEGSQDCWGLLRKGMYSVCCPVVPEVWCAVTVMCFCRQSRFWRVGQCTRGSATPKPPFTYWLSFQILSL